MDAFSLTRLIFSLILLVADVGSMGGRYPPPMSRSNAILPSNIQRPEPISETVRSYFPETWIWELAVVE